jgi:hypothetical protein
VRVAQLLGQLERVTELALGRREIVERHVAEAARVAGLDPDGRAFADERDGAVEVLERRAAVAAAARDGGERVEGFGLALGVAALVQECRRAAEQRLRRLELAAQARDLGAVEERARVRFERGVGKRLDELHERRERAARDPLRAALGDDRGRAPELFGFEQVAHGLLPLAAPGEVVGEARVLGRHARASDL